MAGVLTRNCRIYLRIPDQVVRFYKDYFNLTNDESTATGILEIAMNTATSDMAFNRHKDQVGWSIQSLGGQPQYDEKRFQFFKEMYKNTEWMKKFRQFEIVAQFYSCATKTKSLPPPNGEIIEENVPENWSPVFGRLAKYVGSECDLGHPAAKNFMDLFRSCHCTMKKLAGLHPEYIVDVISLVIPRHQNSSYGVTKLTPGGIPNPVFDRIPEDAVDRLLENMSRSESVKSAKKNPGALAKPLIKPKSTPTKAKPNIAPKMKSKKMNAKTKQEINLQRAVDRLGAQEEDTQGELDAEETFLSHITKFLEYLRKIDGGSKTATDAVIEYKRLILAAAIQGEIKIVHNGTTKTLKGFSSLRVLIKDVIYRTAALKPRPSDEDVLCFRSLAMATTTSPWSQQQPKSKRWRPHPPSSKASRR